MLDSILTSIKKVLGITEDYTIFDVDITMLINSAFNTLNDIGIGPGDGFQIVDKTAVWSDFTQDDIRLNSVQTYVYLRVRQIFDPPTTHYTIIAMENLINETIWRLSVNRENTVNPTMIDVEALDGGTLVVDGGQM